MQMLLSSGFYHGIATHDPRMIAATIRHAAAQQISKDDFEFQMLYGVRTDLQRRLVNDGYRVRIYIPFGRDWFPYFMRRLAERPANQGKIWETRNFPRGNGVFPPALGMESLRRGENGRTALRAPWQNEDF